MAQTTPLNDAIYSATKQVTVTKALEAIPRMPSAKVVTPGQRKVVILVMGVTGSGKTSFINLASGSNLRVGSGLESCTSIVQTSLPFELDGRTITLIDTPGFDDTTKSDTDILKMIAVFLASSYERKEHLVGVIYVHRMSDFRMGGSSSRNFKMFKQICGDSALVNVAIVTNMWGAVETGVGEAREAELATKDIFFKPVLQLGAQMIRNDNTLPSAHTIIRSLIDNRSQALQIQREIVEEHKDISQTFAGQELNRELMEQDKRNREELEKVQQEMNIAIEENDEETRHELEVEHLRLQAEIVKVQAETQNLATSYSEEKAKVERKMKEVAEAAQQESARAAERQRELQKYHEHVQQNAGIAAAEEAEIAKLRVSAEATPNSFEPVYRHERHGRPVSAIVQRSTDQAQWDPTLAMGNYPITTLASSPALDNTELHRSSLTTGFTQSSYDSRGRRVGPHPENAELLRQLAAAQAMYAELPVQSDHDGLFTRMGRGVDTLLSVGARLGGGGSRERPRMSGAVYEDPSHSTTHDSGSKRRRK